MNIQAETETNEPMNRLKTNKKTHRLTMAKLYDNMISTSYTLMNGDLDKEKILHQTQSFAKNYNHSK
jgi:hypothetical protein